MSIRQKVAHEIKTVLLTTFYFAVCFGLLIALKRLMLAEYAIQFRGWSLALLPTLDRYFAGRFHRPLPVSALGQTAVHDRLGFDHRNAIDIAVHPDTPEGRALMLYLRGQRIPFLAFRRAQAGVATGAHVHIGEASYRRGASNGPPKPYKLTNS